MTTINKVAVAGATGNLGPAIVKGLIDAGFEVTILTRQGSASKAPAGVASVSVDYTSIDSLTTALKGQDAVVSTISTAALATQLLLVDAAAKAGVKRFIPSEFGSDTLNDKSAQLPVFGDKKKVQSALKKYAESSSANGMTYTLICTGPFLDWGLMVGFIMNTGAKSINLYDGGDRRFSTTSLSTIAKAVAAVLSRPDTTANRAVYVQDTAVTQKELLEKGHEATGGSEGWTIKNVAVQDCLDLAWAELKKDKPDPHVFALNFIVASIFGDGYGSHFQNLDNEVLGLPEMSDDQVQALVKQYATK